MEIKLDPELAALIEAGKARNPNPVHYADMPIEEFRAAFTKGGQLLATPNIACDAIEDIDIPGPAGAMGARVYTPKDAGPAPLPALIFIHGGGYMIGDLDSHDSVCRQLANGAGVKVIAIDYRLAPEHKFPAAAEDSIAASEWVVANAESLGIDPERIAVGGDSAGGTLSAVVCNWFAANNGPRLAFQLLIYPSINNGVETQSMRDLREGVTLDKRTLEYFFDGYLGGVDLDPQDPLYCLSSATHLAAVPPAHVVTAEFDPLRDGGLVYAEMLRAQGVAASYHCYPGLMHNFIMQTGVVSSARKAVDDMAVALRAGL